MWPQMHNKHTISRRKCAAKEVYIKQTYAILAHNDFAVQKSNNAQ